MEQETSAEKQIPEGTIYKDKAIWVGTALGGPLVTGYLAAKNYKVFGEKDKVWKTWVIAVAATVLIFSIAFYAPYIDRIPNTIFVLVYAGIAYLTVRIWQGAKIDAHVRAGGRVFSWYRVIVVSILGMIITAVPILAFAYLAGEFSGRTKYYGNLRHEILFDESNISAAEVDKIAGAFTKTGYFDREFQKFVDAKKVGNNYEIFIYCNETIKTDSEAVRYFSDLREEIQKMFPDNRIIFNLVILTPDNVVKRLE